MWVHLACTAHNAGTGAGAYTAQSTWGQSGLHTGSRAHPDQGCRLAMHARFLCRANLAWAPHAVCTSDCPSALDGAGSETCCMWCVELVSHRLYTVWGWSRTHMACEACTELALHAGSGAGLDQDHRSATHVGAGTHAARSTWVQSRVQTACSNHAGPALPPRCGTWGQSIPQTKLCPSSSLQGQMKFDTLNYNTEKRELLSKWSF